MIRTLLACAGFAAVLFACLPANAAMTCNTRSAPVAADFIACVSADYAVTNAQADGAASTSDAYSRYQWALRQIFEGDSYASVLGDAPRNVKVAVIDVYPGPQGHPDLVGVYETGINTVEGGTNTNPPVWDGNAPTGSNAHGQCVASVIAAQHNSIGTAGVFARVRIIPVRASLATIDEAIDLAVAAGAEVIHIAGMAAVNDAFWPPPGDPQYQLYPLWPDYYMPNVNPLRFMARTPASSAHENGMLKDFADAIERAVWDHNVIVTTVVGNWDGRFASVFHASLHETVVAAAVNVLGEPSPFNANNYYTTMLAPGGDRRANTLSVSLPSDVIVGGQTADADDVMCAIGPDKYGFGSGGSFAGPHLAAAAAIIKSYLPDATAQDVRRLLRRSAQPITNNLHVLQSVGGMLSIKRLKAAILAE
jgi:hypothetical protein